MFAFQGAVLGLTQITVSFIVNLVIVCTASKIAKWFGTRPTWLRIQRWLMASVLTGLAVRLALNVDSKSLFIFSFYNIT